MSDSFEIRLQVAPDGREPYTVVADTRDLGAWERWPGTLPGGTRRTFKAIVEDMLISAIEEISFQASKRQGLWTDNLAAFREQCKVGLGEEDGEGSESDPTQ